MDDRVVVWESLLTELHYVHFEDCFPLAQKHLGDNQETKPRHLISPWKSQRIRANQAGLGRQTEEPVFEAERHTTFLTAGLCLLCCQPQGVYDCVCTLVHSYCSPRNTLCSSSFIGAHKNCERFTCLHFEGFLLASAAHIFHPNPLNAALERVLIWECNRSEELCTLNA